MGGEVDPVPGGRGARACEERAESDDGGKFQLGAADALRLVDAEELGVVEVADGLVRHAPQLFRARRPLAQLRQQRLGACPKFSVLAAYTSQGSALPSTTGRRDAGGCIRTACRGSRCDAARR